ncbi:MAG: tripartite tricarboxylate transporter permease, partial [Pseudomonadota bacterium]
LAFGIPELLLLTILGFSMVGVLAGSSLLKGFVAVALGMIVGAIGEAPAQGSPRLDFGSWYLQDGFSLVIVGLGIFAIPEIISLLRQDRAISKEAKLGAGWIDGIRDWWQNIWLSIRCSSLGVIVGVIPGLGGSVVDWIAYGHTIQTSKDRESFGKGNIRGVIGPESSNNAKEGGGLVPTLLFGIPGSGSMAVFIGGMILLGYEAGPQMIQNDLPITYTIVWSLALANVVGAGLCIFLSGGIARLTTIRFPLLVPFLFMMISFAAFQSKQSLWDITALVLVGLLGIFMRRFDWSRPAFLIGFVLADQAEVYTYQVTQIARAKMRTGGVEGLLSYLFSPVGLVLITVIVVSVWLGARQSGVLHKREGPTKAQTKTGPLLFTIGVTAFLLIAFIDAMGVNIMIDKVFPATVSGFGLVACLLLLLQMRRQPADHSLFTDNEITGEDATASQSLWPSLGWFVSLLALTAAFGFVIALAIFFVLFLSFRARVKPLQILLMMAGGISFLLVMGAVLNRSFPPGLLQSAVELPWPLSGL